MVITMQLKFKLFVVISVVDGLGRSTPDNVTSNIIEFDTFEEAEFAKKELQRGFSQERTQRIKVISLYKQ